MNINKDIFEIIFFARAGQGAKTAAEIVAQSAVSEGKYVQAFPYFGPERSGAPTKSYVRVSKNFIRTHESVVDPDVVVVLDDTLLESVDVTKNLDRDEWLIINTSKNNEEITKLIPDFEGKIYAIDGNMISMEIIGQPRPNSVVLGKLISVTEIVKIESIKDKFREIFQPKVGEAITGKNILAIEKGYDTV
ncbi:2-oxoacid:acceptor oxidoreductase family protein [Patescibacteria group bacterium]